MDARKASLVMVFVVVAMSTMSMEQGVMGFKEIKVGGHQGWHVPVANDTEFYDRWAASKRLHVGDSLRFEYKNDTVLVVDKYGYYHCDPSKAISTFNDGNSIIKLEHPGLTYFISGSVEYCRSGQRIQVDVMSPHPHPIAFPPELGYDHGAQSPAPGSSAKSSGAMLGHGSPVLGLVVVNSVLLFRVCYCLH